MPLRLRRGTDSTRTSITPVQGEPIYTTDTKKLFIGDGTTAGGVEVGGTSVSNASDNRIITSDGTSTGLSAETNLSFDGSRLTVTGSVIANSLTGSLQGTATTASYVLNAVSSSFATTSNTASTASYVLNAVSSSFATTASYWGGTVTSASYATTASYVLNAVSSSFATTASFVRNAVSSSFATTASFVRNAISSSNTLYFNYDTIQDSISIAPTKLTNNHVVGIGIGNGADNNNNYGIGIGLSANNNYESGVGVGWAANNNYNQGVGVGMNASSNYTGGSGFGFYAQNNYNYGTSVGYYATSNAKGSNTVGMGGYSKAERQNEFVTTATNSTINKAQSIIQKFRQKSLTSAGSIWQEIFTDASSARLTILASSVYHYRIQINAIGATGFLCKTWEITGAIKRDASNNTTMVGGAPTYVITSEDASTSNWDVRVTADDTNEALEIEVKHDYANNVTFSATVWATETRL